MNAVADPMKLFGDEKVLSHFGDEAVVLTTHRLRKGRGPEFTSVMLDEVCYVEVAKIKYWWMLPVVLVSLGAGLFSWKMRMPADVVVGMAVLTVLLVVGYIVSISTDSTVMSRYSIVKIVTAGGVITCGAQGMTVDSVSEFVTALESAKNQRYLLQHSHGHHQP